MSQQNKYRAIIFASVLCSVSGIFIGAFVTKPEDGGRGGAIAVAIAFWVLFVRNDYGARVQAAITAAPTVKAMLKAFKEGVEYIPITKADDLEDLKRQITGVVCRLDTDVTSQKNQNSAITWASCIGTIIWGFGDILACWLKNLAG